MAPVLRVVTGIVTNFGFMNVARGRADTCSFCSCKESQSDVQRIFCWPSAAPGFWARIVANRIRRVGLSVVRLLLGDFVVCCYGSIQWVVGKIE